MDGLHSFQRHWRPVVEGPSLDVLGTRARRKLVECGIGAGSDECEQCLSSVCEQVAADIAAMCTVRRYAVLTTGMYGGMTSAEDGDEDEIRLIEQQIPAYEDRIISVRLLLLVISSGIKQLHDQQCDCRERRHARPVRVQRPGQRERGGR